MGSGGVSCFLKCFLRTLAVVGFICLLLVGTLETQGGTSTAASKHTDAVGRGKLVHPDLNFNYMSKRRVPNGPDPIHNRWFLYIYGFVLFSLFVVVIEFLSFRLLRWWK